ncbi:MAG: hypothetical protein V4485_03830 [Pseudomonadota bacterium]
MPTNQWWIAKIQRLEMEIESIRSRIEGCSNSEEIKQAYLRIEVRKREVDQKKGILDNLQEQIRIANAKVDEAAAIAETSIDDPLLVSNITTAAKTAARINKNTEAISIKIAREIVKLDEFAAKDCQKIYAHQRILGAMHLDLARVTDSLEHTKKEYQETVLRAQNIHTESDEYRVAEFEPTQDMDVIGEVSTLST